MTQESPQGKADRQVVEALQRVERQTCRLILTRDITTMWGTYTAGLTVRLLQQRGNRVTICLDPGPYHMAGARCHHITVHRTSVRLIQGAVAA